MSCVCVVCMMDMAAFSSRQILMVHSSSVTFFAFTVRSGLGFEVIDCFNI